MEPDLFSLIRRKVFTADVQKILKLKGTLANAFVDCGGTREQVNLLHDALEDCKAVATVLQKHKVKLDTICNSCRSLELVQQRATNPLLKAGLVTETVAAKMPQQMTCEQYLAMSDTEVTEMLASLGANQVSIKACLFKRKLYIQSI